MLSTVLITSGSFKTSTLWRACPIISAHFCITKYAYQQQSTKCIENKRIQKNRTKVKKRIEIYEQLKKSFSQTFQLPGLEVPSIFEDTRPFSEDLILLESYDPPGKMQSDNPNI